jgi:amino acid transporter
VSDETNPQPAGGLQRHFGLLQATALNVTMIVGAGVFVTIPFMLKELPGPYALLGWLAAGALIVVDGLVWSELGATLPGSGGSYLYLLECYGRERWGRLMAFLFIWQFLISGPLEIASGLIAIALFANGLSPGFKDFNEAWTRSRTLLQWHGGDLAVTFSPARLGVILLGVVLMVLLYRRIAILGRLTLTFWVGVLGAIGWILVEGGLRFDRAVAFDTSGLAPGLPKGIGWDLGAAMVLAMYSYLGYYHVCYIGEEVRNPGRTIPRAILLSTVLVCLLFAGLHLAMLGTVSWREVPTEKPAVDSYSLPAEFMSKIHPRWGPWGPRLVSLLLIWSCLGSAFAALLGYSRIPYGAARYGHFFAPLGQVHPVHRIPHISLLAVGGITLCWTFFDLQSVINALITTRILEQFIGQVFGVMLLRRQQPERLRPFKMWLYPLPCGAALAGWLYLYLSAGLPFILLGLGTLAVGLWAFLVWSWQTGGWPFAGKTAP